MKIKLLDKTYEVIDTKEKITIADSFVVRQNKTGTGNGEAKLYIGNEGKDLREFFGSEGFSINCFLIKTDLEDYLDATKVEYDNPEQLYASKECLPLLWLDRSAEISLQPELIAFNLDEQTQITKPRIYVKSEDKSFQLIRKLSLPNITYISVVKLKESSGNVVFYFKLFADYFGDIQHPYLVKKENELLLSLEQHKETRALSKARKGQGKYRENLLKNCPFCPITMASDDRVLIASHIKPWAKSNSDEQIDPMNGFMFTPTFDYLFDRGFMSFTEDKKTKLSPFLSKMTYSKLGISDNKLIKTLPLQGREEYLEYHRSNIFQGS